jgi:hypothetical protein
MAHPTKTTREETIRPLALANAQEETTTETLQEPWETDLAARLSKLRA